MKILKVIFTKIKKIFLITFFTLGMTTLVYSQQHRTLQQRYDNWGIGINIGVIHYLGDIGSPNDFSSNFRNSTNIAYGVCVSKQFSPIFGIKGNLLVGNIDGESEITLPAQDIKHVIFKSKLRGAVINATVDLSNVFLGVNRKQVINVYGLVGVGLGHFKGKIIDKNTSRSYYEFGLHSGAGISGYQVEGIGNLGLCVAFDIGKNLKATVESAFKFMKGDNLDDNGGKNDIDSYNYTSFGIAYVIPLSKAHQWYCR